MTQKYKYELRKGSKKEICPNCGKKRFVPFVSTSDGKTPAGEQFGRCDRESSCGYFKYPKSNGINPDWVAPPEKAYEPPRPDFIPKELVEATFNNFRSNTFFMWLVKLFGSDKALELQSLYSIGTAKGNGTIFWQQDSEGNFRTGKVMYYNKNGNRDKKRNSWYLHNKVKPNFELHQVFFGEHLIKENPDKPIALCESEKSAVLMSVYEPDYIWLASGGANMLNNYRLLRLSRLDFVSPDQGEFDLWERQTNSFIGRKMDTRVENAFREGKLEAGDDILDLILLEKEMA